jgi:hypothetical protein
MRHERRGTRKPAQIFYRSRKVRAVLRRQRAATPAFNIPNAEANMKRIEVRLIKKMCVFCRERRARFRYAGRVRWDRFHSACFQCYRSQRERLRSLMHSDEDRKFVMPDFEASRLPVAAARLALSHGEALVAKR